MDVMDLAKNTHPDGTVDNLYAYFYCLNNPDTYYEDTGNNRGRIYLKKYTSKRSAKPDFVFKVDKQKAEVNWLIKPQI